MGNHEPPHRIKLDASPAKRLILNMARSYSPDIAFFELIDNAVDVWRSQPPQRDLHISVKFDFKDSVCSRIRITDQGGGVPVERLEALVQPGAQNPNEQAIGVWGQGLKIACIVLGARATIRTRYGEGPTYEIILDDPWWHSDTWELWADQAPPDRELPPGSFEVVIEQLKQPLRRDEIFGQSGSESLLDRISRIYAPLLSEHRPRRMIVRLEDEEDDGGPLVEASVFGDPARFDDLFAFPPGFPPTSHTYWLDKDRDLKADVVVGLLPQQSRDLSGVTMYGKGRLFEQALKEGRVGFGTRGPALIPASHPTTWRLLVLMYFDGPSDLIPWRAGTKDGYVDNNPYFEEIRSIISELAAPYAAFTRSAKRLDVLPYSKAWNRMSAEEVEKEAIQFSRDSKVARRMIQTNKHLSGAFTPPVVEKIENATRSSPPFRLPCLSLEASKSIARRLTNRDLHEFSSPWGEHWLEKIFIENTQNRERGEAASGSARRTTGPAERQTDSRIKVDEWRQTRRVTVPLPAPVVDLIQNTAPATMSEWLRDAVLKRVGDEIEPILGIPVESSDFWPILKTIRHELLESLSGTQAIGVYGSVATGTADRASDIDIMVVHDDRLLAQRRVNEMFESFRYPPGVGQRYAVNCKVMSEIEVRRLFRSAQPGSKRLVEQNVWIYPPEGFQEGDDPSE